jgi:hypothetical protein
VIVLVAVAVCVAVETVNVALALPAGTVTDAGTVAADVLLFRLTTAPPMSAGPARVTVPVEEVPPTTLAGARLTPVSAGAVRAVRVIDPPLGTAW